MAIIDLRNAIIYIKDGGTSSLEIKVGEGNLTYTEKREIDDVKSRGKLDTMRESEDQPMEVSFSFMWEYLKSQGAEVISPEEALKGIDAAAGWVSASPDPLAPYCTNIEILHTPLCLGVYKETVLLPQFNPLQFAHSLNDATVACNGKCNSTMATVIRTAQP